MWDGLLTLLGLSTVMAFASFLAGSLPLSFSLSRRQLRIISAIGTGILVGTALIIIIPEGVDTLYSASSSTPLAVHAAPQSHIVAFDGLPGTGARGAPGLHGVPSKGGDHPIDSTLGHDTKTIMLRSASVGDYHSALLQPAKEAILPSQHSEESSPSNHQKHPEENSSSAYVGLALIAGFTLMFLIDSLPPLLSAGSTKPHHISLRELSVRSPISPHPNTFEASSVSSVTHSTTIGLVIHATADGIALGASSASPAAKSSLGLIIFFAILVHKAPAAFGLTAVLLKQGFSKRLARAHLAVFSLAAPVGALLTWIAVNLISGPDLGQAAGAGIGSSQWWTGLVLVFSGGTFLYVAMHSMNEQNQAQGAAGPADENGIAEQSGMLGQGYDNHYYGSAQREARKEGLVDVVLVVVGMLLPLLTQLGHSHGH